MKKVFAIKGKGGDGVPYIGPPSKAKIVKRGVVVGTTPLYIIGVDSGKEKIMSGLEAENETRHRFHFPADEERGYDANFFNGLLSETMEFVNTAKGGTWKWVKLPGHNRNEALDCRNYANAAYKALNPALEILYRKLNNIKPKKEIAWTGAKRQESRGSSINYDW